MSNSRNTNVWLVEMSIYQNVPQHAHAAVMLNVLVPFEFITIWGFYLENIHLVTSLLEKSKKLVTIKENAKYF